MLLGVPGIPALLLAMPAITGGFQGGAGRFGGLAGEIGFYAVKLGDENHPEGIGFLFFRLRLGGFGDPGGFGDKLHITGIVLQTAEVVEIHVEIVDHAVAVVIAEGLYIAVHGLGGGFQLVGGAFVPVALSRPDALELGFQLGICPAVQAENVVAGGLADDGVLFFLGSSSKSLWTLQGASFMATWSSWHMEA